jgi:hypothetical protein
MTVEALNDPNNKLSYYMKSITTSTQEMFFNPFAKVYN